MLNLKIVGFNVILCTIFHLACVYGRPSCKAPIDVTGPQGVRVEPAYGSRVDYKPLPKGSVLELQGNVELEFRPEGLDSSGLVFAAGDYGSHNMVAGFMHKGHLVFARRCGHGNVFEIYRKKLEIGKWHRVKYEHDERGGDLIINGHRPFRQYHMGPCPSFTSLTLGGGLTPAIGITNWTGLGQNFVGCIRNLKINGKQPDEPPEYYVVSMCKNKSHRTIKPDIFN